MIRRLSLAAAFAWLALAGPRQAGAQADIRFILSTVAGDEQRGSLLELRQPWTVRLKDKGPIRRDAEEWTTLRREGRPLPPWPVLPHLILADGDRLPVTPSELSLASDNLQFRHAFLGEGKHSKLALSAVAAIFFALPDTANDPHVFCRRLTLERPRRDIVLLRNGDSLEGVLVGFDRQGVRIRIGEKTTTVELGRLAAISLSNLAAVKPQRPDVFARLTLADGSRLSVREATSDRENITGTTLLGTPFRIPVSDLRLFDLQHARVVRLAELKPAKYEHTPYLGASWPLSVDATLSGGPLRLGGSVFDRGLAMHSASRVTYTLPEGARRFEATVGLDERLGARGSVVLRVLVDGKERDIGLSGDLTHRKGPIPVRADVAGAKELTLVVDFGANGDVGDHVNWVEARILR